MRNDDRNRVVPRVATKPITSPCRVTVQTFVAHLK
jgi:hypothetical protein